jgi:hypothetical protein
MRGEQHVSSLRERVEHEMLELVPPTIFFLIAFHIIAIFPGVNASCVWHQLLSVGRRHDRRAPS